MKLEIPAWFHLKKRSNAEKRSKFTEQQIAYALKQAELSTPVEEVCRKMGISDTTFYNWKKKYGGLRPSEVRRLKQLEEENANLKKLIADLSLDKAMLQDLLSKNLKPSRKRLLIDELRDRYRASLTQTCALFKMSRSLYAYQSTARDATPLILAHQGNRNDTGALRIPPCPRDAQAGRLEGESEAGLSPLSVRRPVATPQATKAKQVCQTTTTQASGHGHQ